MSSDTVKHETLAGALCALMADVGTVQKTGKLPVGRGKEAPVATVEDITGAIQPLAAKHGVVFMPTKVESVTALVGKTKYDSDIFRTDATVTWLVVHRDSDQRFECQTIGSGNDSGDKGGYKAMTGAEKYLHRLILCLPTGDDPDKERSTETSAAPTTKPKPSPKPAPKQTTPPNFLISDKQRAEFQAEVFREAEQAKGSPLDDTDRADIGAVVSSVISKAGFASSRHITKAAYAGVLSASKSGAIRFVLGPGADDESNPSGPTDSDPLPTAM